MNGWVYVKSHPRPHLFKSRSGAQHQISWVRKKYHSKRAVEFDGSESNNFGQMVVPARVVGNITAVPKGTLLIAILCF